MEPKKELKQMEIKKKKNNINPPLENEIIDDDISIWDVTLMDGLEDEDFSYEEPIIEE